MKNKNKQPERCFRIHRAVSLLVSKTNAQSTCSRFTVLQDLVLGSKSNSVDFCPSFYLTCFNSLEKILYIHTFSCFPSFHTFSLECAFFRSFSLHVRPILQNFLLTSQDHEILSPTGNISSSTLTSHQCSDCNLLRTQHILVCTLVLSAPDLSLWQECKFLKTKNPFSQISLHGALL